MAVEVSDRMRIARIFGELGLSLRTVFPDPLANLEYYRNHRWVLVRKKSHRIIHAVPMKGDNDHFDFWEEWCSVDDGPVVHHILFKCEPPVPYHEIYEPPETHDGLHPKEIYGCNWYVVEDPSMRAWAVQSLFLKN